MQDAIPKQNVGMIMPDIAADHVANNDDTKQITAKCRIVIFPLATHICASEKD